MSDSPEQPVLTPLQRAFLALQKAQSKVAALESASREPIAIIGLGCRVPGGGHDAQSFWRIVRDGIDATGPLPGARWDVEALYDADPETPGRIATRAGGFLGEIDTFDPVFFGITRREAQGMDPQQRLLLEVAWEALENAGRAPDRLQHSPVGVYVGVCASDYANLQLQSGDPALLDSHFASGIAHSIASGRISYLLGLQGPSVTLDTACSSSLVALHLACQALRAGDCDMALAGGVNLILSPDLYIALSRSRMLSPEGRCKTFDAAADGFARGEGCGVVVLKRLSLAQADGDRILAVVRSSAVNQDGPSSGLTAPNGTAQEAVVREALARARLAPREISYVEAHGTGTQLGDPLEVRALGAVFGADRGDTAPLLIGSVKTNLGHLEAAAGVTGLIKLVLSLCERAIPAHLNFSTPSPHIPWDELPLKVPTALTAWEPIDGRRIAGLSSFGFSGTNAHVIVEEAPARDGTPAVEDVSRQHLFILSARNAEALAATARRFAESLATRSDAELAAVCFTAATSRATFAHRAVVTARSMHELVECLAALGAGRAAEGLRTSQVTRRDPARIAFLFTGQGAQYAGMTRSLYEHEPVFRAALDRCAALLADVLPQPLLDVIFAPADARRLLDDTGWTQPALFAVEYALAQLWRQWGIVPDVVMGHSVGEFAAACVAGVLPLEHALRLIAERGRLMQSLPAGGSMAAIFAGEDDVRRALATRSSTVSVAAVNAEQQTVISGAAADVDAVCAEFTARGIRCQKLAVSHAFHSPMIDPVLQQFERAASAVPFARPELRLISNLTGRLADAGEITQPRYWRRHAREAVRFADGVRTLGALKPDICIEVGPQPTLLAFAAAQLETTTVLLPTLRKGRPDRDQMAETLGSLFLAGAAIDWRAVWSATSVVLADLPSTPFQRERCWFRAVSPAPAATGRATGHPLLGTRLRSALRDVAQFELVLEADDLPYLRDHVVNDRVILPATGFAEMALSAGREVFGELRALSGVVIASSLVVQPGESRLVQAVVRHEAGRLARFEILSTALGDPDSEWQLHANGEYEPLAQSAAYEPAADIRARCVAVQDATHHYEQLAARGLVFGPSLRGVQGLVRRDGEALGEIMLPASADSAGYVLHPALLDASVQVVAAALPEDLAAGRAYLPMSIGRLDVLRPPGTRLFSHVRVAGSASSASLMYKAQVTLFDAQGVVATLADLALRAAGDGAAAAEPFYEITWQQEADAAWLPSPATLAAQVGPMLEGLAGEHDLQDYQLAFTALETMSVSWILRALLELGWAPVVGARIDAGRLADDLSVAPRYHRLLLRFLEILGEEGLLQRLENGWLVQRLASAAELADPAALVPALMARHPASRPRIQLTTNCGNVLGAILKGTEDPLQQLFPQGSAELAEALYRDAPEAKAYNQLVRETLRAMCERLPAAQKLRILEVGGGTGGTTAWVAPVLPADRCSYRFTDIGALMVSRARERFGAHAFMSFQTLDLELDIAAQLAGRQFDVVIASNVIHATADLGRTLAQLRGVLAPGGVVLMLEVAGMERWIDITFGLTEGWWRFTDTQLRDTYPLLTRARWLELLESAGFEAATIDEPHDCSREVLLAARKPATAIEPLPASGSWLIVSDEGGIGDRLAQRLRAAGQMVRCVPALADAAELRRVLEQDTSALAGVVHLGSLDVRLPDTAARLSLIDSQRASLASLLELVQTLGRQSYSIGATPRLWIATRGAQGLSAHEVPNAAQAPVWGLGRVIALEHPEWRTSCLDLDPSEDDAAQALMLLRHLSRSGGEDQIAVREGGSFVARLASLPEAPVAPEAVRLEKADSGVFDEMQLRPTARRRPGPGEVEIRVRAAGLNFRDIMNAVALRADPEPLGGECAGIIVGVGAGVQEFVVGDAVLATGEACFATYVTTAARHVAGLPRGVDYAQGATLPFAFMTAYHALVQLGDLRPGMSVLIHAAAGGVGMAAVQLALRGGATIFATAGSEEKRALLRSLGVAHVFNSRTLEFTAQIQALTRGRGVDLVLNSLAGDFISASVKTLAEHGCFLEIGKRDIWTAAQFSESRPLARYHAIDLNAQRYQEPAAAEALFREVMRELQTGTLRPLPYTAFGLERAGEAFRYMAQARHVGKVVLTQHDALHASLDGLTSRGVYLISGGLSGIGLLTARLLVDRGARHLMLAGRRAPSATAIAHIEALRARGATIHIEQADFGNFAEVARVVEAATRDGLPLRGVIHSAGLLEDGALLQQDWQRFVKPLGPKVDGSWALHALTLAQPLDFFVLYSSMAAVLGSSGQGNHAAANAFMDALALHRRAQGLPALSISWGAWSEIGAAAERQVDHRVGLRGIGVIDPESGLAMLEKLMRGNAPHVAVFPVHWERFIESAGTGAGPFLERMRTAVVSVPRASLAAPVSQPSFLEEIRRVAPGRRQVLLVNFVAEHVARVVDAPSAQAIDPSQPLNELGLDSLMAVELRNRLGSGLGLARSLPATLVFDHPTLEALADYLSRLIVPPAVVEVVSPAPAPDAVGALDDLSDEQIEALFAKKLRRP